MNKRNSSIDMIEPLHGSNKINEIIVLGVVLCSQSRTLAALVVLGELLCSRSRTLAALVVLGVVLLCSAPMYYALRVCVCCDGVHLYRIVVGRCSLYKAGPKPFSVGNKINAIHIYTLR